MASTTGIFAGTTEAWHVPRQMVTRGPCRGMPPKSQVLCIHPVVFWKTPGTDVNKYEA